LNQQTQIYGPVQEHLSHGFVFIQDFLGKSDPYLELARSKEDGTFVVVHRTEVCLETLEICI